MTFVSSLVSISSINLRSMAHLKDMTRSKAALAVQSIPAYVACGKKLRSWNLEANNFWVVVWNIFYVHPYLGKIPILTNIFPIGLKPPTRFYFHLFPKKNPCKGTASETNSSPVIELAIPKGNEKYSNHPFSGGIFTHMWRNVYGKLVG